MTLKEAIEKFKEDKGQGLCLYGVITGGPAYIGFSHCCHTNHKDVRIGCKDCPKHCKDFEPYGARALYGAFRDTVCKCPALAYDVYHVFPFYGYKYEFSNFYQCRFELWGHTFNCGEQAFVWKKAETFNDLETANKILTTDNPSTCKGLSRRIKNYDDKIWSSLRFLVMYNIVYAKVTQNPEIKELLLNLRGFYIYEDSPYDSLWGVGPDGQGENLLGKAYMEVRDTLLEEQK